MKTFMVLPAGTREFKLVLNDNNEELGIVELHFVDSVISSRGAIGFIAISNFYDGPEETYEMIELKSDKVDGVEFLLDFNIDGIPDLYVHMDKKSYLIEFK